MHQLLKKIIFDQKALILVYSYKCKEYFIFLCNIERSEQERSKNFLFHEEEILRDVYLTKKD